MSPLTAALLALALTVVVVAGIGVGIFWRSGSEWLEAEAEGGSTSRATSGNSTGTTMQVGGTGAPSGEGAASGGGTPSEGQGGMTGGGVGGRTSPTSGPTSGPTSRGIDGRVKGPASQALGADRLDLNLVSQGQQLYVRSCVMCHGPTGQGVGKLGNSLAGSTWVRGADLGEVAEVIQNGRSANDPANRSRVAMPARGGLPALTSAEIDALAAYCKSLAN